MRALAAALADASCVFVAGKGGVGKTTTAGALALALADRGEHVHLITTDPAESLGDLFGAPLADGASRTSPCTDTLTLEAFAARAGGERWLAARRTAFAEIIEQGTYLENADVEGILALAVPGVDEAMGALRLVELAHAQERGEIDRIVVDTAPTGHTLRLLDAGLALASWLATLRAMAHKAAVVASALLHAPARLSGERVLDELDADLAHLDALLHTAAFVVVHRSGSVVRAETERLATHLDERRLHVRALVAVGDTEPVAAVPDALRTTVPILADPGGCAGLRAWASALNTGSGSGSGSSPVSASSGPGPGSAPPGPGPGPGPASVFALLTQPSRRILWFAGKGGVGKSTCAAAAALVLAEHRPTVLYSTDPAGSLGDLFGRAITDRPTVLRPGLTARQVEGAAAFDEWRVAYHKDVASVFASIGIDESVALDRRVIEAALDLAPLGIDEIVALDRIVDGLAADETLVVDTAPTGHFLRLLESPALALDWLHALLRILLRYGVVASLDDVSRRVLAFAKRLKALRTVLTDATRAGVFVVTLDEPMVRAETDRLRRALRAAAVPEAAVILNRASPASSYPAPRLIRAPELATPPVGEAALRAFIDAWELA